MQNITFDDIVKDLQKIGVKRGDLLNVKVSLKSVGNVIGGAKTIINALLDVVGDEGTIVTESYIRVYPLPLSKKHRIPVNDKTPAYTGAVANAILEYPNVVRSQHPVQKFAAIGKLAEELMLKHTADSYAYDVLRRMSEMGGKNINIGPAEKISDHGTGNVAIYKCNLHQKRGPMGVMYTTAAGDPKVFKRNWSGDCFEGLKNFHKYYKPGGAVLGEGYVGNAQSLLTDMGKTLAIEIALLKKIHSLHFVTDRAAGNAD